MREEQGGQGGSELQLEGPCLSGEVSEDVLERRAAHNLLGGHVQQLARRPLLPAPNPKDRDRNSNGRRKSPLVLALPRQQGL